MITERHTATSEHTPILTDLYFREYGVVPQIRLISGGGSPRKYYRLTSPGVSVVGVEGNDLKENEVFLNLDVCLAEAGINVPHIISVSGDKSCYLLQDLGDENLMKAFQGPRKMEFAKSALEKLIEIQTIPEHQWCDKVGWAPFSERLVRWDLNYFKYDFLKPYGVSFDEEKLENDFDRMAQRLMSKEMVLGLMYRDFQSRNVMVKDDQLWFIDFQGARKGPVAYDAVSFIWQAKAPFTFEEREHLERFYIELYKANGIDPESMERQLNLMKLFRSLQVLGAYGFRGLIERKQHFIESIPFAIGNLAYFCDKGMVEDYPELSEIIGSLIETRKNRGKNEEGTLTLKVFSFSYKKGYPEDETGNGGGFMFDCRAIHNPGRYEEYKQITGRDAEVMEFLQRTPEAEDFVNRALTLVKPSVERYLKRGFTSLQVGFGCTGGQHRSVYCADKFAMAIKKMYPEINVEVIHREQGFGGLLENDKKCSV